MPNIDEMQHDPSKFGALMRKAEKAFSPKSAPFSVNFDTVAFGTQGTTLRSAVVETDETYSKIIILCNKASVPTMTAVSAKLHILVQQLSISGSWAEAEMSPLVPKQFDFVLFNVPSLRADGIRNFLVQTLLALPGVQ